MRELVYTGFMSLDGVVDSPGGGPGEEHRNGGWVVNDIEFLPEAFALKGEELAETTALMFGRRSYETMPTNATPSGTGAVPVLVSAGNAGVRPALALPEHQAPVHRRNRRHLRHALTTARPHGIDPRRVGPPCRRTKPHRGKDTHGPDTDGLRSDLLGVATRVADTIAPMSQAMLPLVAASADDRLTHAAAGYWTSLVIEPLPSPWLAPPLATVAATGEPGDDETVTDGIEAIAFDVNETLFSLDRLRPAFSDAGLDPGLVPLWFARVLRDGFALTSIGDYRPFADLAADTLHDLDPTLADVAVRTVTAAMRELQPHPDVEPALRALHAAGMPVVTLTNGSADTVHAMLDNAGLTGYVRHNLSVDAVRRWKPAPQPYRYAAEQLGVDPHALVLVATHPWDCAGAHAAGLRAAWVQRSTRHWPTSFPPPRFVAADLVSLTGAILADR